MRFFLLTVLLAGLWCAAWLASSAEPTPQDPIPAGKVAPANARAKADKAKPRFTIGKTTTYVDGPLAPDGRIDYAAALNQRMSKGITPLNNSNVLLWQAMGPRPAAEAALTPEFFRLMGIDAPPDEGEYFIDPLRFVKENPQFAAGVKDGEVEWLNRVTQRHWAPEEFPAAAAWLKANEKPLVLVVEATKRPQFYSPLVTLKTDKGSTGLINAPLPGVQACRWLASALAARAMLRVRQGAADEAWQDLLACHRLGRLVGRGGTPIEALVGIAIDSIACRADLAYLDRARLDAPRIDVCLRDLRSLSPLPEVATKVDLADRFMFLDIIMLCDRHGFHYLESLTGGEIKDANALVDNIWKSIDWDPALETANRWYDRMVACLREKDRPVRVKKLADFTKDLKELMARANGAGDVLKSTVEWKSIGRALGQSVGDILITRLMTAADKVQDAADRARQTQDNVILAYALARYRLDHGRYPERLDALVPKYAETLPGDLFSGKGLIYRPDGAGYLLYSVGINGRDEDGRGKIDVPPADDLVVRMPLAELKQQ